MPPRQPPLSPLEHLIGALRCLPGVGPRSAQRMAYHLLQNDRNGAQDLTAALTRALNQLRHCARCNNFSEAPICDRCADPQRQTELLCVVEMPADLGALEQTRSYKGLYYVLMGHLSPLDGIGPKELKFEQFLDRVMDGSVKEVILATNFTTEGEATAHTLAEMLKPRGLIVSRLSRGVPVGGELELTDAGTVAHALLERRPY